MIISDWINIICATISLVVTVIIAVLQIKQSNRMEKFERRQDAIEEERHAETVRAQAVSFVSKYYSDRGLIPLCSIAAMYNDLYYYSSEMYREYCCYTKEVQNKILEYCNLDLRITEREIFPKCVEALESIQKHYFPDDKNIFYDGAKYLERSLRNYGSQKIPHEEYQYEKCITDIISEAFRSKKFDEKPIEYLALKFDFGNAEEIEACQLTTFIAECIAIYGENKEESNKYYGAPGAYDGEEIKTMEDLFLKAVFEIYTNLVI